MLRIGPLLLSSSRRPVTQSVPATFSARLPSLNPLLRSTPTTTPRFLSSNNAGGDNGGDLAVKPRPAQSTITDGDGEETIDRVEEMFRQRASRGGGEGQNQRYPQHRSKETRQYKNNEQGGNTTNKRSNNYGNSNNQRDGYNSKRDNNYQQKNRNIPRYSQQQQQSNTIINHKRQDEKAQKESHARLRSLMEDLKRSAHNPTNTVPLTSSPSSSSESLEKLPPIPSLRQRFQREDHGSDQGNINDALPPLNLTDRPFRFRQTNTTSQSDAGGFGTETAINKSRPTMNPGYRMPRRQQDAQRNNNHDNNNNNNNNYQKPVFRDSMEFLQARRVPKKETDAKKSQITVEETKRTVTLPGGGVGLPLSQTSTLFRIKVDDIQQQLKSMGFSDDDVNDKDTILDTDTLELLALEYGIETVRGEDELVVDTEELLMQQRRADDAFAFPQRPPVVTIMGHVDHGKTTLLDALRRRSAEQQNPSLKTKKGKKKKETESSATSNVAGTEAGGITQVVSAFQVEVEGQDNKITFLDTPGHAAFKSMRQSGSHAADVIVLVVAADDGVSEQTVEILEFYKSIVKGSGGGISMVVALNKIDKPGIDAEEAKMRIENQLLEHGIICEGMKGDSEFGPPVQVIPTSGLTGQGLDDLMDGLILQSEVMDLRADHDAHAEGIIMDARMEKGLGVVVDCIIRWGSIEKGDFIVSGSQASRVRMLKDVNDKVLKSGIPSQPVRIVGFKSLPKAGDPIVCVESEEVAEEMVERVAENKEEPEDRPRNPNDVEIHINGVRARDTKRVARFHQLAGLEDDDGTIRIPIVVKADADGSLSAVRDSLVNLGKKSSHKVIVDPIQEGIGEITPTDIQMAKESNACIFAFGLKRIDQAVLNLAESEGVIIRSNDIIYSLLDDAKETLGRYLPPQPIEQVHGRASIQAMFVVDGDSGEEKVAGLKVLDGNLYRDKNTKNIRCNFRVYRKGTQISPEGQAVKAHSLRRFKELVESVRHGEECGLVLMGYDDFQEGDEVECYSVEMKTSSLQ